jgi:GntR family transcriptional repressor for pyruvate dehydrogenase complex
MPQVTRVETATAEGVLEALEHLVLDQLEPRDSLPSEGELARQLGVSRLTIREAVKTLAGRGLVEVRQGRPAIVSEPNAAVIGSFFASTLRREPGSLLELLEVRQALEIHIARLAAERCSRAAVVGIELALNAMRAAHDTQSFHEADMHFHEALAMATSNRMLNFLLEALEQPLRESFRQSQRGHELRGNTMDDILDEHQAILDRVRERDARGAAQAMRRHLETAELDLKAVLRAAPEHSTREPHDNEADSAEGAS